MLLDPQHRSRLNALLFFCFLYGCPEATQLEGGEQGGAPSAGALTGGGGGGAPGAGAPPISGVEAGVTSGGGGSSLAGSASPPLESEYGGPCQENSDCQSGLCVASPWGFICSQGCLQDQDCPDVPGPMRCTQRIGSFGPDLQLLCAPDEGSLCQPCFRDDHCFGGRCLRSPQGDVCSVACGPEGSCPDGSECRDSGPDGAVFESPQCVPDIAKCGCTEENAGQTRSCVRSGDDGAGRCFGEERCEPETGWTGCDAPSPSAELCDGVDNDCNGVIDDLVAGEACLIESAEGACPGISLCQGAAGLSCVGPEPSAERCDGLDNDCDERIDEGFINERGAYQSVEHCGACQVSCPELLPLAESTACEEGEAGLECVITSCREGFYLASPTVCLPLASRLCEPCERDSDCGQGVGDRCVAYEGQVSFCGRDCSEGSLFGEACPEGFSCNGDGQCELNTGSCLCGEGESFIIPCSVTSPSDRNQRCVGSLTCDDGALSACELPPERCDDFDDDCDGRVDEDFIDLASGDYISDEHCGRCDHSCFAGVPEDAHGVGACLSDSGSPRCGLICDAGYVDVNAVQADGCECELLNPNSDEPDPLGIDANCDGIDGEVTRGIFVSPAGDDSATGDRDAPLRTIQAAIGRATGSRDHVYVAAGVYTEAIQLRAGVSIFGGYSADYARRDLLGNETAIFPPLESQGERLGTITGLNISSGSLKVSGFTIIGFDESNVGKSSYAVYLRDCSSELIISDNVIRAGTGGPGLRGGSGSAGSAAPNNATEGAPERAAAARYCSPSAQNESLGGQGGTHQCLNASGQLISTRGGDGGTANCPVYNQSEDSGSAGLPANGGAGGRGGYNQSFDDDGFSCYCFIPFVAGATEVGVPGQSGSAGALGGGGSGCSGGSGRVVNGHWIAGPTGLGLGGSGSSGAPGGGGGGGGAGSGVQHDVFSFCQDFADEVIGGGGGGGGAGGCGGTGGLGGSSGGGSFGVMILSSQSSSAIPTIRDNSIERGFGGAGGDGGEGGEGGEGALGREALALPGDERTGLLACADPGGRGGDGGEGGDGGGGGGGCGGISAGVFISGLTGPTPAAITNSNSFPATGSAGAGGRGGLSLGNQGASGADGSYVEVAR